MSAKQIFRGNGTKSLGGFLITLMLPCLLIGAYASSAHAAPTPRVPVPGQSRSEAVTRARQIVRVPAARPVTLTFALPLRDQAGLADLLDRLYDPADPSYGHYLTPQDFADRFGPAPSEIAVVSRLASAHGLTLQSVSANRTLLRVTGPARAVEAMFGVHLHDYADAQGRRFYAPDAAPTMTSDLAAHVLTVVGLDSAPAARPFIHAVEPPMDSLQALPPEARPLAAQPGFYSSNPTGLTPADIHTVYNVPTGTGHDGRGQTLAVFELDSYYASDIAGYEAAFGLPSPALQNIGVDGFDPNTTPGGGQAEVNLDIELEIAMCPAASSIVVYEAANTFAALIDEYNKIAGDDLASVISSSWGIGEDNNPSGNAAAENQIFEQMAAQGQTMTAAAGDGGAYSDGTTTLACDDPGSQPYVLGVGGTNLSDASSGTTPPTAVYTSESSWGDAADTGRGPAGTGGGGGISHVWSIPSWQVGAFSATVNPQGSTTMRNVPDVSLDGDYDANAYAVYLNGSFAGYNGTSAASPVWAGLMGLVNQQRAAGGAGHIGFATPAIYAVGKNAAKYAADFHDIKDGSNNLYYNAVPGYDDSTGWGSFIASALIPDLVPAPTGQPVVTSISPTSARAGSGAFTLTVNGANFATGEQVAFAGHFLTTTVVSAARLTATVSAALLSVPGTAPVTADNPATVTASNAVPFTISPTTLPVIASFTPATGPAGTTVVLTGMNFTGATLLGFQGRHATSFTVNPAGTQITTTVPVGAVTGPIAVQTPIGIGRSPSSFVVPVPPAITSFTPASGPVGKSVTLTGHGFTGATSITFNGVACPSGTYTVVSDTQVTVTVPQYATSGKIVLTTSLGTATSAASFTVTAAAVPTITSFAPTSAFPGASVTITGTNFFSPTAVKFNGTTAAFTVSPDGTTITTTVPVGATTGPITVVCPAGTATSAAFTVQQPPANDNFIHRVSIAATITSPGTATGSNVGATLESGEPLNTTASGGHTVWWSWTAQSSGTVTIDTRGSSFDTTLGIYTGSAVNALTLVAGNDDIGGGVLQSSVTFTAVAGTQYQISVDGYSANVGSITVHVTPMGPPAITSFTPASGPIGTVVTLSGHGFTGLSGVTFNGTAAGTYSAASDTQATATVPQYATSGKIVVTTPTGTATSAASFTVTAAAAPAITAFTPTSAFPGASVTITGTSFFSPTAVKFNGTTTTFTVSNDGTTITAVVPTGATTGPITVICPAGTATSTVFTVSAPPSNDNFVSRVAIAATTGTPGTATGSNAGATLESGEPLNTTASGTHTVWWSWTAQSSGTVTIDTLGSSFDTTLGIYTGSAVNALTLIASDDDYSGTLQSGVTFTAVAGTQYQISVDGYSTNVGSITVHVTP